MQLRRTKIVATLGPSTDDETVLESLIISGADVVRLNFSHGDGEEHLKRIVKVREISKKLGKHVAILGDLQGPKIRILSFRDGEISLHTGGRFSLNPMLGEREGDLTQVGVNYERLSDDVTTDDILLLDDGRIKLRVLEIENDRVHTEVMVGGTLSDNKGINRLGGGLSAETLTEKDRDDIIFAAQVGIDYLAVSFPRNDDDLRYARHLVRTSGGSAKIVSKIERAEIVSSEDMIDAVILASDAVMVARGDLGVEVGNPALVEVQKKIISRAHALRRAVITATQMMESMVTNPVPTRAEVMDVANAVLDGTDAVMLSAETASGRYPVEAVSLMSSVCIGAEKIVRHPLRHGYHENLVGFTDAEEGMAFLSMQLANSVEEISAVISVTDSERAALLMSRIDSSLPIFALSRSRSVLNLINLYRGVVPVYFDDRYRDGEIATQVLRLLRERKLLAGGELVVLVQGDLRAPDRISVSRVLRV